MQVQAQFVEPVGWLQSTRADLDWRNRYLSTSDVLEIPQAFKGVKLVLYAHLHDECLRVIVLEDEEGNTYQSRPMAGRYHAVRSKETGWQWVSGHKWPSWAPNMPIPNSFELLYEGTVVPRYIAEVCESV